MKASVVTVTLTVGGGQTLHGVRLSLQLPQGWTVTLAAVAFGTVRPGRAVAGKFRVTLPRYSPDVTAVVHATATIGGMQRDAGVSVSVRG